MKITLFQKGFTLIELLVVVAIIGILSALLMSNFVGIRQRARDGQRKSDLRQIQSALELYRADNGSYPTDPAIFTGGSIVCNVALSSGGVTYMKSIPCDPLGTASSPLFYQYVGTTANYCIRACLENTNDSQKDPTNDTGTGSNVSGCNFVANICSSKGFHSYTLQNP
jgi:general secretion pathway protein G